MSSKKDEPHEVQSSEQVDGGKLKPETKRTPLTKGALDIQIHPLGADREPCAELLLTDEQGRRTGQDTVSDTKFEEIPESMSFREGLDTEESGKIFIPNPENGAYRLEVVATRDGEYTVEIKASDEKMRSSKEVFRNVKISRKQKHAYLINYSNQPGSIVEVKRPETSN